MAGMDKSRKTALGAVLRAAQSTAMPSELVRIAGGSAEVLQEPIQILQHQGPTMRAPAFALANLRAALEITRF